MSKLYIIGNGFDIAHNIKSKYVDFRRFMETSREYDDLLYMLEEFYDNTEVDLWSEFEEALGLIMGENVFTASKSLVDKDEELERELRHQQDLMHWNKSPQRATLPGKTAFYGTLCHDEEPTINMRYIALLEASKLYRQGINATGKEQYTLSRWRTNSELRLAVFVHDTVFTDVHNNRILEMAKMEREKGKTFIDGVFQFEEYGKYVTEEFAKPVSADYEYIISATIAEKLLYATGVDGVMYPSVRAVGEYGMNVAMRPDVADEKLILTDVREMEYA